MLKPVFTQSTVLVVTDDEKIPKLAPGTMFCAIVPGDLQPGRETLGGGRKNLQTTWNIEVIIKAETNLDSGNSDLAFLTDATLGVYAKLSAVVDVLHLLDLPDSGGKSSKCRT